MIDISTYRNVYGDMANQVMGCSDGYYAYLMARCDAHVQLYYQTYQHERAKYARTN